MDSDTKAGLTLAAFLPYRLSVLSNTISGAIAARYDAAFGISIRQWRVMAVLGEGEALTATEIVARTAMDKVAVSRAVADLETRELIARTASTRDARQSVLSLTGQGRDIYAEIAPMALDYEREVLAALSQTELEMLTRFLDRLAGAASPDRPLW